MFSPPVPDEELQQAVEMVKICGSKLEAARQLGFTRGKLDNRLRAAALRGFMLDHAPAMPGFRISQVSDSPAGRSVQQKPEHGQQFEVPKGHVVKGVSALLNADGGEIVKWVKTKEGQLDPLAIAEELKKAFADYKPCAASIAAPASPAEDLLTLLPCGDWHINLLVWGEENDGENWDLKIAEKTIGEAVESAILRSPPSAECIVLGGGDLLHADNNENKTAKSGNALEVDSRYQKGLLVASKLMVRAVDACLRHHQHVTVRILPGNHDEHSSVAVAYFLLAWYRNEPRVTVDASPSLFFWYRFGQVLLGATHGHTVKIAQMPSIMAHRRAEDWGATKFRLVHGFHLHHSAKIATESNGVICEVHQAPVPKDAWHHRSGYISGRSVQAITYHKLYGEIGRVRTAILDAESEK